MPGARGVFYYEPNVQPALLAVDESLKQTTTVGELNTGSTGPTATSAPAPDRRLGLVPDASALCA
ncbi:MAG: hypothetical protein GY711_02245 [bacterium]|nr:hypothetical protein [bacterium]